MSESSRGGKRIKIVVYSICYPHSKSSRKKASCLELPIVETDYHRPAQAVDIFVNKMLDDKVCFYDSFSDALNKRYDNNLIQFFFGKAKEKNI